MNNLIKICATAVILFLYACRENPKNKEYQNKLTQLKHENDSLKQELAKPDTEHLDTSVSRKETAPVSQPEKNLNGWGNILLPYNGSAGKIPGQQL